MQRCTRQRFYVALFVTCAVLASLRFLAHSSAALKQFHYDEKRPFEIRASGFLLHGQPFTHRIVSCECDTSSPALGVTEPSGQLEVLKHKQQCRLHYFRIPREYWEDRLLRSKALGCNTIQVRRAHCQCLQLCWSTRRSLCPNFSL